MQSAQIVLDTQHSPGDRVGQIGGAEIRAGGWELQNSAQARDTGDGLSPQGREGEITGRDRPCITEESPGLESSRPGVNLSSGTSQR